MNEHTLLVYLELAESFDRQQNAGMRDLFLMLAADAALKGGRADEAERLRQRLLKKNPHHLLRPYASFAEAASLPDIQSYLDELRQKYPPEQAEEMLETIVPLAPGPSEGAPPTMPPTPRQRPPAATPGAKEDPVYRLRPEAEPRKPDDASEPLKVYRGQGEAGEAQPPRPPREGEKPAARKGPPRPVAPGPIEQTLPPQRRSAAPPPDQTLNPRAAPSGPAPRPKPAPARRPAASPRPAEPQRPAPGPAEPESEGPPSPGGAWVGVALFALVLAAGLALALLTLAPQGLFQR